MVADLTHGNRGAYWEAGFAEGLGVPVIYTCRKDRWEAKDSDDKPFVHFDTNHRVTILWDLKQPEEAAKKLTARIRATLPAEAKMSD
jgi:nucleoside 2-deoxyribosyltransferase